MKHAVTKSHLTAYPFSVRQYSTGEVLSVLHPTGFTPWIVIKQNKNYGENEYQFMPVTEHSKAQIEQFWTKGELFDCNATFV